MKYIFFISVFILISCVKTTIYLEDGSKKKVNALIKTGNRLTPFWSHENFQTIKCGIVYEWETIILMDNNKFSIYNYNSELYHNLGDWTTMDDKILLSPTFPSRDSLISFNTYYTASDDSDSTLICFVSNSSDWLIPYFYVYDSNGNQTEYTFVPYNYDKIRIPKNAIASVEIRDWSEYLKRINIIPKDTFYYP